MVIDRAWAVRWPFTHKKLQTQLVHIISVTFVITAIEALISSLLYMDAAALVTFSLQKFVLITLLITYPVIAYTLYRKQSSRVDIITLRTVGTVNISATECTHSHTNVTVLSR